MLRCAAVLVAIVACHVEPPMPPQPPPPPPEAPRPDCTPAEEAAPPVPAYAWQVVDELAATDRAIQVIDDELFALQRIAKLSRPDAIEVANRTIAAIERATLDGEPGAIVELAHLHQRAAERRVTLERDLGPKHPELRRARATEAQLANALQRQRGVELALARAWLAELAKLPKTAAAANVHVAWARAMRGVLVDMFVPTDAPHEVRIPALIVRERTWLRDSLRDEFGPKHPDRLRADAELTFATETFHDSVKDARSELDDPDGATRSVGRAVADRSASADQARTLRAELAALAAFDPKVADARPGCLPPAPRDPATARLAGELASIDRELDALDDALIDAEAVAGIDRVAAMRRALMRTNAPNGLVAGYAEGQYLLLRLRRTSLERELGPKNVELLEAIEHERAAELLVTNQREVEANFGRSWFHEVAQLRNDQPIAVRDARLDAMRDTITVSMKSDRLVPSDAPREVMLPALALIAQRLHVNALPRELGPKHPERIAAEAALANAEADFQRGANAAIALIDRRIASTRAVPVVDSGANGRRRQLVERAREPRAKLAELLGH